MTGLVILAAGESARMGKPKQQLLYQGKTLLQRAVHNAVASVCEPVVVILGAYAEGILAEIRNEPVTIIHNRQWQEGMASSIGAGIAELKKNKGVTEAVIMLCDQPFVDTKLINTLVEQKKETGKGIVACAYKGTCGVPVLFARAYFSQLLDLKGHDGAKKILPSFEDDMALIDFPAGEIDIDTPDDYNKLL